MVTIRSTDDIVSDLVDFYKSSIPLLDTKPGTVARSLMIDSFASITALLYDEVGKISNLQSLRLVSGSDLDRLAQNLGATRKSATKSSGVCLLTFSSIPATIGINPGSIITGSSGATFTVVNGISVDSTQSNFYKSIATKYQANLGFLNITDQYAVEVSVKATTAGSAGNISQYAINSTGIAGVSNATNIFPFTGGTDQENDATFRNRVLSIFSGSNVGTSLGYKNLVLSNSSVIDAIVVGPGNPLMTRDGTQVIQNTDGSYKIISEGTGGKVDIIILGNTLSQFTDTFIYLDKSNTGDPTNSQNDFILGQIPTDSGKSVSHKRIDDIASGSLPAQPVEELLQITGSLSGGNFIPKTIDNLGRVSGNYELIKDTGVYSGSPWSFDRFHWTSNQIVFQEDRIKAKFNGQDATTFSDVIEIPKVQQNISITNENSLISAGDRSMIQLLHTPATNTTRVFNVNTGENYTIINQNVGGTGTVNTAGVIQISGNTLPSANDILQVNYTWIVSYDPYSDYDGKILKNNPRPSTDSIDWGMSNIIRNERVLFTLNSTNTLYVGNCKHPISSIVSANYFKSTNGVVAQSTVPNFSTRLEISLNGIDNEIDLIESIKIINSNEEIYNTSENNGFVINNRTVINAQIKFVVVVMLPTDTVAKIGDIVEITYNQQDVFNVINSTGSFNSNQITIPAINISVNPQNVYFDTTYISSAQNLLSAGITNLPVSRSGNGYIVNSSQNTSNSVKSNILKKENQTIQLNTSNQHYIDIGLSSSDYSITLGQIISVIDLNSNKELWNNDFPGTLTTNTAGNYRLIFSGFNTPATGDNVLAIYYADDIRRFQPFTFGNDVMQKNFQSLLFNFTTNNYYIPIHNFIVQSSIQFTIIDNTTGLSIGGASDGYIASTGSNGLSAIFGSSSFNFSSVDDLFGKTIRLINTSNNNTGNYTIASVNLINNEITIQFIAGNLLNSQISVVRVADGKDLWTSTSSIDTVNNLLELPATINASQGDSVVVIISDIYNLRQSPTKLSISVSDQLTNTGIITASGTTITQVQDIVFTAIFNGLRQNLLEAMKTFLGLTSNSVLSSQYLIRVVKLEKVNTTTNNEVLNVISSYDIESSMIRNNLFYSNEMTTNQSLGDMDFILPASDNNISNEPKIGDKLRITFYYATDNDSENVYFTKNGTLYTNKKFALLEQLYISSGFSGTQSAQFVISGFTQPSTGSRYTSHYNYIGPKQNERILINYNYNSLITNTTFTVETSRPITADVLVRAATELPIDATLNIVISNTATTSAAIIIQNVQNAITGAINTNKLGDVLSSSSLIATAQAVDGVERVRILYFNVNGGAGQVLTITAQQNQYFAANTITVNQENIS